MHTKMHPLERSLTIVVPTLWKVETFPKNILLLAESNIVSRVIVIDNNPTQSIPLPHPKIQVISKGVNMYVNPAWNLGVKHSPSRFTCLLNDDVDATTELLEYAISILNNDHNETIGLIGMEWSDNKNILSHRAVDQRDNGFGEILFFRTKEYSPIPSQLKIWCGDDYLLLRTQLRGKKVVAISGFGYVKNRLTSTTINSDRERFNPILKRDLKVWLGFYRKLLFLQYHPISTIYEGIRYRINKLFLV
ncbi:MAG: hypothetical protein HND47_13995 [Chloroflexi bacterium]|nr:hypothetical protein [Chloroflexota bacterium]